MRVFVEQRVPITVPKIRDGAFKRELSAESVRERAPEPALHIGGQLRLCGRAAAYFATKCTYMGTI